LEAIVAYIETPDGVPLYYEDHGSGETIVLVHAWTMNAEYWWQKNVSELAKFHRVVALDLRGHGLSGKTDEGHTLAQYARDVRHLGEALDLAEVTLVGWSMGASVILDYLTRFGTDGVRSVAFVEQSPRYLSAPEWEYPLAGGYSPEALAAFNQNLRFDRSGAAKRFIRSMFSEALSADTIDEMYAETTKTPTSVAVATMTDMTYADLRPALEKVTVPTLLLYGAQSKLFPEDLGGWLQDQIPDSKLVMFEESGHCPFWEEPEKFNREVASFVG
jgi:pimeloyl-ACP methyl ester carboxylesterase